MAKTLHGEMNDTGWETLWQEGRTNWDMGSHQPALEELFQKRSDLPRGSAVVCGCGTGYDVAFLASQGYRAVGIDSSATAIRSARKRYPDLAFEEADFFAFTRPDLCFAYDWTFICSFPPAHHQAVASKYGELLPSGTHLATLIFPIDGDREGGPPYSVSLEEYERIFGKDFELVEHFQSSRTVGSGSFAGRPMSTARQRMALWKRK